MFLAHRKQLNRISNLNTSTNRFWRHRWRRTNHRRWPNHCTRRLSLGITFWSRLQNSDGLRQQWTRWRCCRWFFDHLDNLLDLYLRRRIKILRIPKPRRPQWPLLASRPCHRNLLQSLSLCQLVPHVGLPLPSRSLSTSDTSSLSTICRWSTRMRSFTHSQMSRLMIKPMQEKLQVPFPRPTALLIKIVQDTKNPFKIPTCKKRLLLLL